MAAATLWHPIAGRRAHDHRRAGDLCRAFHWNRVRVSIGAGNTELYLCTRHHFAWYALNVLELPPHQIALQLGHTDGGILIRQTYGHPDAAIARERIREAFKETSLVTPLLTAA